MDIHHSISNFLIFKKYYLLFNIKIWCQFNKINYKVILKKLPKKKITDKKNQKKIKLIGIKIF